MVKKTKGFRNLTTKGLGALANIAKLSATLGVGTASNWGHHQPKLPSNAKR